MRSDPIRLRSLLFGAMLCATGLLVQSCGGASGRSATRPAQDDSPDPAVRAPVLEADEVLAIMEHAVRAVDRQVAVAVTDRRGVILGVATNFPFDYARECATLDCPFSDVDPSSDCALVDRAVQLARTAAFFSADQTPLTSRSVRFLSGEHFPSSIRNTGAAALFGIENTNRGCSFDADFEAGANFNAAEKIVPRALNLAAALRAADPTLGPPLRCENAGDPAAAEGSALRIEAERARCGCTRGIATFPGGVPIYKKPSRTASARAVGGVGVAIRGNVLAPDAVAAFETAVLQQPDIVLRREADEASAEQLRELALAELAARAYAGDDTGFPTVRGKGIESVCTSTTIARPACCSDPEPCDFNILPARRLPFDPVIFVDGIEIPEVAPNPPAEDVGSGDAIASLILDPRTTAGAPVATGWLVGPNPSTAGAQPLSAEDVRSIIEAARDKALAIRGAIRLPLASATAMMLAVSDTNGALIGLFRMNDATVFSIDVAVAKSRNVLYFSDPAIDPIDLLDCPGLTDCREQAVPAGTAITNRTLSFSAQPFFPSGIEGHLDGFPRPFAPGPFRRVFLEDSRTPCTNGRQPANGKQNGIVFFPGSAPLYRDGVLVGGFGVSGDGVEQDDIVTVAGAAVGFEPPGDIRADRYFVRGVRLPYVKFNRRPEQ